MAIFTLDKNVFYQHSSIIAIETATNMRYLGLAYTRTMLGRKYDYEVYQASNKEMYYIKSFNLKNLVIEMKKKDFSKIKKVYFQFL